MSGLVPPYTIPPTLMPPITLGNPNEGSKRTEAQKHMGRILTRVICLLGGLGGLIFIISFDLLATEDQLSRTRYILHTTSPTLVVYLICLVLYGLYRPADANYITRIATIDQSLPIACLMLDMAWIWTFMLNDIRFVLGMTSMLLVPWVASFVARLLEAETLAPWCTTKVLHIRIANKFMSMRLPIKTADEMEEAFRVQVAADLEAGVAPRANTFAIHPPANPSTAATEPAPRPDTPTIHPAPPTDTLSIPPAPAAFKYNRMPYYGYPYEGYRY